MARFESIAAGLVLAALALGLALVPLQSAAFTRSLSRSLPHPATLSRQQTTALADLVRRYVVSGRGDLPREGQGAVGFSDDAVSHLDDVQRVLRKAQLATGALLLAVASWMFMRLRRTEGAGIVALGLLAGGGLMGTTALLLGILGVLDFDAVFAAFHGLFFANGTWVFPSDSLLIQLFPERFWIVAAGCWAGLVVLIALSYGGAGLLLRRLLGRGAARASK